MPRLRITISKEAQKSLMELQRKMSKPPSDVINKLLLESYESIIDDEICKKEYFPSCVIYQISMPFCFIYDCEYFDFYYDDRNIRLYLERVPKKHITYRSPLFHTRATIIIELNNVKDFPENKSLGQIQDKISKKTQDLAFNLLKNLIISLRRVTRDYYNIGTIKPPMFLADFLNRSYKIIINNNQHYSAFRTMHIKEGSEIVITHKLDNNVHKRIMEDINQEESDILFSIPYNFFDQSIISYYDEEWDLCLIQGVISMESALSRLVKNSKLTPTFIQYRRTKDALNKNYKDASGLPKKICRFVFPFLKAKNLTESENMLKKLMPLISNNQTKEGIYDLRSKIVHEGLSVSEKEAKKTINNIVPTFFNVLNSMLE